jgi:hypothetical protein
MNRLIDVFRSTPVKAHIHAGTSFSKFPEMDRGLLVGARETKNRGFIYSITEVACY